VQTFLAARVTGARRHGRRRAKMAELEKTLPEKLS
jgi:hypothetical protein